MTNAFTQTFHAETANSFTVVVRDTPEGMRLGTDCEHQAEWLDAAALTSSAATLARFATGWQTPKTLLALAADYQRTAWQGARPLVAMLKKS